MRMLTGWERSRASRLRASKRSGNVCLRHFGSVGRDRDCRNLWDDAGAPSCSADLDVEKQSPLCVRPQAFWNEPGAEQRRVQGGSGHGPAGRVRSKGQFLGHGPAGEQAQGVLGGRAGGGRVGQEREVWVRGEFHGLERQVENTGHWMAQLLGAAAVEPDFVCRPPGAEILAVRGELPTRADSSGSWGLLPVAVRRIATESSAAPSQSTYRSRARASRKAKRARLPEPLSACEKSARPSRLAARMSMRWFRIPAGASVIASSKRCRPGRTVRVVVWRRLAGAALAAPKIEQVGKLGLVQPQHPGDRVEHALGHTA